MKYLSSLLVLLCIISVITAQTTLKLLVSSGSNKNWIAVKPMDAALETYTISVKQATQTVWTTMTYEATGVNSEWFTYKDWSKVAGFDLPLSFRLSGANGKVVQLLNSVATFPGVAVPYDSYDQYTTTVATTAPVAPTTAPTARPTTAPIAATAAPSGNSLKLEVSSGSNKNWMAVRDNNAVVATASIEIMQASFTAWVPMTYEATGINLGYWTYKDWTKVAGFDMPLSFRMTGVNGVQIVLTGVVSAFPGALQLVDCKSQYVAGNPTAAPTVKPPAAATAAPTTKPVSATSAPTTKPVSATAAPTTKPTAAPTAKPVSPGSGCTAKTKMIVPLYVYPGAAWDQIITGARSVKTIAIINPNSGPASSPNSDYQTYMQKLNDAGVDMVGYVYTQYGARAIAAVKADINTYATQYPLVKGIFLDEGANGASQLAYYLELHRYIMAMPGYEYNIINPGTTPDSGYLNAATQIVTLENYASLVSSSGVPSYASCQNKEKFSAIVHTASASSMQSVIDSIISQGYFGYVYVTDGAGGCCTYNQLSSYYTSMATYIGAR
jgi:hypothetical protein